MKKKSLFSMLAVMALTAQTALTASAAGAPVEPTVVINGVKVYGDGTHMNGGQVYVDAAGYAELLGLDYTYDGATKQFTVKGKTLSAKEHEGEPSVAVRDIAAATGAEHVLWEEAAAQVYVLDLPDGTVPLEPVQSVMDNGVPGMGQHWGNPAELPIGPIYGVEKGKLVFIEQMILQDDFTNGVNHVDIPGMKGMPSPPIVHSDFELVPNGHPGFEVPHYDVHHYFVTHEEHLQFSMPAGGGEPGHGH